MGKKPLGGAWNYDKNNRNKWKGTPKIPKPFKIDITHTESLAKVLDKEEIETLGTLNSDSFLYPSSRKKALLQLDYFIKIY